MTTTTATKPTRKAGWQRPGIPRKRPVTEELRAKADEILYLAEIRTTRGAWDALKVHHIEPTGDENVRLLVDVLSYASWEEAIAEQGRSKSRFNMGSWVDGLIKKAKDGSPPPMGCGTAACAAGTAAAFTLKPGEYLWDNHVMRRASDQGAVSGYNAWQGDAVQEIERRGQHVLGLNHYQARGLFYLTGSKLDDIKVVASVIAGRDLTGVSY